jgi:hypothetical protein
MTTRTAEWIVKDYIADLKDPALCMRKDIFNQRSYSIWAAEEVLRAIQKNKDIQPIEVIENFIAKMDQYSLHKSNTSYIFSIAYDIAVDIADILLAMT